MTSEWSTSEDIEQFNHAIDNTMAALDPQTRQIVGVLHQNHVSLSQNRAALRDRLLAGSTARAPRFNWSAAMGFAVMLVTVVGLVLVMSPQSAFAPAAGISSQVEQAAEAAVPLTGNVIGTFGGCSITDGPTGGQRAAAGDPNPYTPMDPNLSPPQFAQDAISGEALAGFDVWLAGAVPGGRQFTGMTVISSYQATQIYAIPIDAYSWDRNTMITLRQTVITGAPCECAIGSTPLVSATVRGVSGYWLEDLPALFVNGAVAVQDELWWEEGGFAFVLSGDNLTLEEAVSIAESVSP